MNRPFTLKQINRPCLPRLNDLKHLEGSFVRRFRIEKDMHVLNMHITDLLYCCFGICDFRHSILVDGLSQIRNLTSFSFHYNNNNNNNSFRSVLLSLGKALERIIRTICSDKYVCFSLIILHKDTSNPK